MKIIQIIPYFGKVPAWLEYFMDTCSYNPEITWMIYGDIEKPSSHPSNLIFINSNRNSFNQLVSQKLSIPFQLINPYKICDLRPAYGKIFEDYIMDFDFWGYSDLDLIYGDISKFIPFDLLDTYDIIASRNDYFPGHFMLFRNNKEYRYLYKNIYKYNSVFRDTKRHYAIDEHSNLIGKAIDEKEEPTFFRTMQYKLRKISPFSFDLNRVLNKKLRKEKGRVLRLNNSIRSDNFYIKSNVKNWSVVWRKGKLTEQSGNRELMYFHFLKSKNTPSFKIEPFRNSDSFDVNLNGFRIVK